METSLNFLPCVIPPKMYVDKGCYIPPDVHYFNTIYYSFNMNALLQEIDQMPNPDEDKITKRLQQALNEPFLKFVTVPDDSALAFDLKLLLRHKLVHELKWFGENKELTWLMDGTEKFYLDNCCYCFGKKFSDARTYFGDTFDELWTMVMHAKNPPPLVTPMEKASWLYNSMKEAFKYSELGGNIQAQVNFHTNSFISFVINTIKAGKQISKLYTTCCNHNSD